MAVSWRRALLLFAVSILVLASILLGVGVFTNAEEVRKEDAVRDWIESRGGQVWTEESKLAWLPNAFLSKERGRIVEVALLDQPISSGDVLRLAELRHMHDLVLSGCSVTRQALANIAQLECLSFCCLADTNLDDEGLKVVCQNRALKVLQVSLTQVSKQAILAAERQNPNLGISQLDAPYNPSLNDEIPEDSL